jgi:hypothetical protein
MHAATYHFLKLYSPEILLEISVETSSFSVLFVAKEAFPVDISHWKK